MFQMSNRSRQYVIGIGIVFSLILLALTVWVWKSDSQGPGITFVDATERTSLHFRHTNGAAGRKLLPETMGSGVVVFDYDGDGRPDLFFVNSQPWPVSPSIIPPATSALYRNNGNGTFSDVTQESGLGFELFGMGAAAGDFDNDGFPDLLITAIGGCRLFHNVPGPNGRRFVEITESSGISTTNIWPKDRTAEFYNWERDVLFPSSATWLDYDGDGKLDLFVCNYVSWSPASDAKTAAVLPNGIRAYVPPTQFPGTQNRLYRNRGNGKFEDVSELAGIFVSELPRESNQPQAVGKALGVIVSDFDHDGWPDIMVANDTVRNFYFHNRPGPNGTRLFEEIGLPSGVAYADGRPRGGMGIDVAEIRPGQSALMVANFSNEPLTLMSLVSPDRLLFQDRATSEGVAGPSRGPMKFGSIFCDFDLDGHTDLMTCNGHLEPDISKAQSSQTFAQPALFFWNIGSTKVPTFRALSEKEIGPDLFRPIVGRGVAFLDFNGDGSPDLIVTENGGPARLFENRNRTGNRWVRLHLQGNGTTTNRQAVGAEVEVDAGGKTRRWYVTGSRGYLSQSELVVTVGLGREEMINQVRVRWPGSQGEVQTWSQLKSNFEYRLVQGTETAEAAFSHK